MLFRIAGLSPGKLECCLGCGQGVSDLPQEDLAPLAGLACFVQRLRLHQMLCGAEFSMPLDFFERFEVVEIFTTFEKNIGVELVQSAFEVALGCNGFARSADRLFPVLMKTFELGQHLVGSKNFHLLQQ